MYSLLVNASKSSFSLEVTLLRIVNPLLPLVSFLSQCMPFVAEWFQVYL